ncbi:hypothetical protein QJS10_CPA09g01040 [Acorus calamus]|uniref:Uncharacterized protein n=1 Tax=Acorus calamus TaxID=4465 RepID=A0AAV9E703_ACOCL|nr:hypothetical protein QJS10_CPA09g01040 [Acorus calamus]
MLPLRPPSCSSPSPLLLSLRLHPPSMLPLRPPSCSSPSPLLLPLRLHPPSMLSLRLHLLPIHPLARGLLRPLIIFVHNTIFNQGEV